VLLASLPRILRNVYGSGEPASDEGLAVVEPEGVPRPPADDGIGRDGAGSDERREAA
jgi:hypothetical protein